MAEEYTNLDPDTDPGLDLLGYVIDKRDDWRKDYQTNYQEDHEEYYRLWRAKWAPEDKQRASERSQLIAPALQQAVESSVAEVEEATFGRGFWFDIRDDLADPEKEDIELTKNMLMEKFHDSRVRKDIAECLLNAAVTGTGIGEIVLEEYTEVKPATRPAMEGQLQQYGVEEQEKVRVRLIPIKPGNFLIEPTATSIEDAVGVIIDQYVPQHQVEYLQDTGVYDKCDLGTAIRAQEIEADPEISVTVTDGRVRLTKYFGLIPKTLLSDVEDDDPSRYVEGIVVIANDEYILKAQATPYMMKDRPVIAFPWDIVPSRFWGRGICEKGYMSQKALDTELRARIDALALIVHPMMAMDATRMPRGFKMQIRPGKNILTQGNPQEILHPIKFGNLDANTFTQAQSLQEMVQQATGAIDSTGLLSSISGDTKAGAVSMSLGAVIKRHKRTLINFQDSFLLPFVKKAAWRYMQFDPENFPVKDFKFTAASSLGIIAREYEVSQLISLLQTMSPDTPLYPALIRSIVDNMNLANRENLLKTLDQASQPDPEEQKAQQEMHQVTLEKLRSEIGVYKAQAAESNARANKYTVEAQEEPKRTQNDLVRSITAGMDSNEGDAQEFDRRMKTLDSYLKYKKLKTEDKVATAKIQQMMRPTASKGES